MPSFEGAKGGEISKLHTQGYQGHRHIRSDPGDHCARGVKALFTSQITPLIPNP
jgi:hypothetical protein